MTDPVRLRAEAERELGDLYRMLVESVQDYAVVLLDRQGRVASWNPGARRIDGYTADEIIGQHYRVFYPEPSREVGYPERQLEAAAREGRVAAEEWRLRKDGSRFWASVVVTALYQDDELLGFGTLTSPARRTEEAERTKSQFVAMMSHELRTPLSAIIGYEELLSAEIAGPINDEQRRHLGRIRASATHLRDMINHILSLSRIEAGREEVVLQQCDVAQLVRDAAQLLAPEAEVKGLVLKLDMADAEVAAYTDPAKVHQILVHLVSNAIKFTDAGSITVRVDTGAGTAAPVRVVVQDTGPGIAGADQERIFDAFTQVDQSTTRAAGGSGLGLAVSRKLARLLGGDLDVDSEPGEGSRFTLRLPREASTRL